MSRFNNSCHHNKKHLQDKRWRIRFYSNIHQIVKTKSCNNKKTKVKCNSFRISKIIFKESSRSLSCRIPKIINKTQIKSRLIASASKQKQMMPLTVLKIHWAKWIFVDLIAKLINYYNKQSFSIVYLFFTLFNFCAIFFLCLL